MKKSLIESKTIRLFLLLWGLFTIGMVVSFSFDGAQNWKRNIVLAGLILIFGSLMGVTLMLYPVQTEIKVRYSKAIKGEKVFLTGLFYFARGFFLLTGVLIMIATLNRKDILLKDLAETGGAIASIEVYGDDNSDLRIIFENNSNEYETRTLNIPTEKLQQIQNELKPGDFVFVLIRQNDENVINDPYIQIYGVRTESYNYLSLDEYNKANSTNNSIGFILGIFFTGSGLIYLLTGKINANKTKQRE